MTQGHIIISLAFLDGHSGEIYSELTLAMCHFCEKRRGGGAGAETQRGWVGAETKIGGGGGGERVLRQKGRGVLKQNGGGGC